MSFFISLIGDFGSWLIANHFAIAFALTATALVVFGESINSIVRRGLKPYNILIRFLAFVALCVFGYGFLSFFLSKKLSSFIGALSPLYAFVFVVLSFLILAIFANKNKQV